MKTLSTLMCCFFLLICCGCGKAPTGTITGKVVYQGKPVTTGSIVFRSADQMNSSSGLLDANGAFTLGPMPVGEYQVGFVPQLTYEDPNKPDSFITPPPSPLPAKYHQPASSGITCKIEKGANTADYNLE